MSLTYVDMMIDYLRKRLPQYAEQVSQQCAMGFNDDAKKAETFYKHLFNCLGFQFDNMNSLGCSPLEDIPDDLSPGSINYPAIDLGDKTNRKAVQVSFQRENLNQKIKQTYAKFLKHGLQADYDNLIFLFPTASSHPAPDFDSPGVNLSVITQEDLLGFLIEQRPLQVETTYEFVRYWLDDQLPEGQISVYRDEYAIALSFEHLVQSIRYPYANVMREPIQRYLEVDYCESVREFVRARTKIKDRLGGHLASYPFLREFRELEQRIDYLANDLSAKFFGSLYSPMPRWQYLQGSQRNIMAFMPGAPWLEAQQKAHCELIGRQVTLLIHLINDHREMIRTAHPLRGLSNQLSGL
ncbi:hypothetical protein [Pseudomonas sp. GOM6]|uniref:hypothetical protein n=1 Tax=Pseudomonas sp. GOM6 TaxID=3036944 RepID=UPI002408FE2B|nr:hypothetical protein [Pseudomonas sp. GOM6]MDG1580949.1 hypothetical protein [Pseudomonas sp. GOM6]